MSEPAQSAEPVFYCRDGIFVPTDAAGSPWSSSMIHGGAAAGLLAYAIEKAITDPGMQVVRLTVDLFTPVPKAPLEAHTTVVRQGRRVQSLVASLYADGQEACRATALLLRHAADAPAGFEPGSRIGTPPTAPGVGLMSVLAYGRENQSAHPADNGRPGLHRLYETHRIAREGSDEMAGIWVRLPIPFIGGEETSPLVRIAAIADIGSMGPPRSNGSIGLINADLTIYLHRLPRGEWIGLEPAAGALGAGGLGIGGSTIYDEDGTTGFVRQALLMNTMPARDPIAAK